MNNNDVREIDSITFGIYSPEEIMKMTVCTLDSTKKTIGPGTIYDPRMGTTDSSVLCPTCGEDAHRCVGHFGRIILHSPVVHPLFYKRVTSFLNCFCLKCCRLVIQKDQILLSGLNKFKGEARFVRILEKLKKIDICCQPTGEIDENGEPIICGKDKPKIKFITADSSYQLVYSGGVGKNDKTSIILSTEEIKKTFDNILPEDVVTLGFDPRLSHPRNFIISILPVLPPCDRPYVKADNKMCDDDLTNNYCEIIKANNNLAEEFADEAEGGGKGHGRKKDSKDTARQRALASLRFRILTTFNNSQGKAKHTTNGRPIKGIKERLTGKDGQIRNNMMGKRAVLPDTPVYTWSGKIKKAEDILIGEIIIGDDGLPRKVIDTVSGESPLYKVIQSYGNDYGISCEHILTLKFCGHCKIFWRDNQGKEGGWFMSWYDRDTKTCKTKKNGVLRSKTKEQAFEEMEILRNSINNDPIIDIHIKDYLKLPTSKRRLMMGVKLSVPIQWEYKEIKLDPRILGMWLGDGGTYTSTFTNPDSELIDYWKKWASYFGGKITTADNLHHNISFCNFLKILRDMGVYNNKHIPEEYIINDINTRRLVLAGLIDTDGSVEQDGATVRISQCNEHKDILDGAYRIAISLGLHATIRSRNTMCNEIAMTSLELTISGAGLEDIPTLLPRKKCTNPLNKDMSCYNIEVIEDGIGKFCGFEVDQNNRFLLGDTTITHNCDYTARTVIGPEPTLRMGELGVPKEIAAILTKPDNVTAFNIEILQKLVDEGKITSLIKPDGETVIDIKRFRRGTRLMNGDIIHRDDKQILVVSGREMVMDRDQVYRNGELIDKLKHANRTYKLNIGWTVNRPLQDGDYVLLNRQPTLHMGSMLAMQVKIKPYKTLRFNLSVCKSFNSDFDQEFIETRSKTGSVKSVLLPS